MKSNCIHCQLPCKQKGKTECTSYNPISKRPQQIEIEIREAFSVGDYEKGRKLQDELFRMNHG